jgi:hypothetical protein
VLTTSGQNPDSCHLVAEARRRNLRGKATAGRITHELARHFAARYRNPLGFAYGLHGGMDSRLERTSGGDA